MPDETMPVPSILDEDLSSVDTRMPVIVPNILHNFLIKSLEVGPNKAGTGQTMKITLVTTTDLPTTAGDTVNAGFPVFTYIGLTPTAGGDGKRARTEDDIRKDCARFVEAVEGKPGKLNPIDRFKGKYVKGKVGLSKPNDQYPNPSNTVTLVKS